MFFVFRDSYVLYIYIYVMNILCAFHASVSGYGTLFNLYFFPREVRFYKFTYENTICILYYYYSTNVKIKFWKLSHICMYLIFREPTVNKLVLPRKKLECCV